MNGWENLRLYYTRQREELQVTDKKMIRISISEDDVEFLISELIGALRASLGTNEYLLRQKDDCGDIGLRAAEALEHFNDALTEAGTKEALEHFKNSMTEADSK